MSRSWKAGSRTSCELSQAQDYCLNDLLKVIEYQGSVALAGVPETPFLHGRAAR